MADLPEPEVQVDIITDSANVHKTTITARRDGANRGEPKSWEGYGHTAARSVEEAVKRYMRDPLHEEFSDPKPKPKVSMDQYGRLSRFFMFAFGVLLASPTWANELTAPFPPTGHSARDFQPPMMPVQSEPLEHARRGVVAPGASTAHEEQCVVAQPGGAIQPGTVVCGRVQSAAPMGRPPIGAVMEGPGLK